MADVSLFTPGMECVWQPQDFVLRQCPIRFAPSPQSIFSCCLHPYYNAALYCVNAVGAKQFPKKSIGPAPLLRIGH